MIERASRILFQTRDLKLLSSASFPKFSYYKKKDGGYSDPMMDRPSTYLGLTITPESRKEIPFEEKSLFILEPEYYTLVKAWMEVWSWFSDASMRDLFIMDENNNLKFNSAYNDLGKTVSDSKRVPQKITVMPTLVMRGDRSYEGVMLHLRSIDIQTTLTKNEFGTLLRTLQNFSFVNESILLAMGYAYAEMHKTIQESTGFSKLSTMDQRVDDVIHGTVIQNRNKENRFQLK